MRSVPEAMAAQLEAGVSTLAHVWRIVRRDGVRYAFTDHDQALSFDDLTCDPLDGASGGAIEKAIGLGTDSASISGALSAEAITEDDLARGLWDGARVDLFRAIWNDTEQRVHLFAGRLGEVRRGASAFEAELRGLQAALNVPVGRVFSRHCDADLGDVRCGKNIESEAFRATGAVIEAITGRTVRVSGLGAYADGWFSRGRLVWADGGESEVVTHRVEAEYALLQLRDAPSVAIETAAEFTIYAGCDKRFETCRGKFANSASFRGFPHMPGNDAVIAGPHAGDALDGGSRFS